jgi:hypothetical protein
MASSENKTSPLVIAVAWIIVLIPLGWGVVQSVVKSMPLFQLARDSTATSSSTKK